MTTQQEFALKQSQVFKNASFSLFLSFALSIIFFFNAYDFAEGTWSLIWGIVTAAYFFTSILQGAIVLLIKKDLLTFGAIQKRTRLLSGVQLISLFAGNVFTAAFAFRMLKKRDSIEYTLAYYMFLTQFVIFAISLFNLFKPYVSNLFIPSMTLLILAMVIEFILIIILSRTDVEQGVKPLLKWLGVIIFLIGFTGNFFGLILGYSLVMKSISSNASTIDKWNKFWISMTNNFTAMLGFLFVFLMFALSIASYGTFVSSFSTDNDYNALLLEPSLAHPFGTDNFGRDVFSRIVFGARISLIVGLLTTLIPLVIGGFLGAISGYYQKSVDNIIMRLLDVLYAVPGILLAIAIIAAFGSSTFNLILALSVGSIPTYARTMRANVLMVSNLEYVEAAKALGENEWKIIFKQIVPNAFAPMIVKASLTIGGAVIATSSLSFLGLGVEPHIPEWGNILKIGSMYLETNPYLAIFPGIAIILLVLSFNFLGDGLRDALDPKLDV
ncbi:ABC transporter permease [Bacillus sp. REN16]|uniref:ABC transporter permease n=1 Tax=Bacillus sp. REN16 TaxID=2887296 RepID=UPI001E41DD0D|nr:ABC transporter permease subunit [Bacillus sp. REN16]MCC3357767.1 ABC transporter permease subunit [Bacillus sp. REN16]